MSLAGGTNQTQAVQAIEAGKQLATVLGGADPLAGALLPSTDPLQAAARDPRFEAWRDREAQHRAAALAGVQKLKWIAIGAGAAVATIAAIWIVANVRRAK